MLNRSFEPPVRSHEGERDGDLGVHGPEGPVLPEEEDRRLCERDPDGHKDDDLQQDPEEKRDHTDEQDDCNARLGALKFLIIILIIKHL